MRTLDSLRPLLEEAGAGLEVIVQDGGTAGIEQLQLPSWVNLITGADDGIYDAMNRGLSRSVGERVWFLNGGDESIVRDWESLAKMLATAEFIFADYELAFNGGIRRRRSRPTWYICHALPTSHQAIIYPGDRARDLTYDTSILIAADYDFTARLIRSGCVPIRSRQSIARFYVGGASLSSGGAVGRDANRVQREVLHLSSPIRLLSRGLHSASIAVRRMRAGLR